jgi:hypothetical protein
MKKQLLRMFALLCVSMLLSCSNEDNQALQAMPASVSSAPTEA